ncbi:arsenite S-adenosylmethyltransferase [Hartmannibacter diazotrophicus]|uniref:Arsenite S-adenosylmethyltransferase n=1 Tax=Hartmannibacter diazotrophicus TaxID=1482074 RepID=A0A2C9DC92_9HYPH|nr:FkbM family methyltransferase [Hartmannibacter diazotrophicus]SON57952.1 arsenite S-adenosylmethyltransferase [Hartmannibacter diazotrophicus]
MVRYRILHGALKKVAVSVAAKFGNEADIEINGLKMRCRLGDNATETNLLMRGIEAEAHGIESIIGELYEGETFVDIGANCGLYTLHAARSVGRSGRVLAAEPIPEMLKRLEFNIAANDFGNVQVLRTAVGDTTGHITLHVNTGQFGQSSVGETEGYEPINIPVTTLPALVHANGVERIDAMKIDIEGYEDRVIMPMLAEMKPALWPRRILMEICHRRNWNADCLSALTDAGYGIVWQSRNDALLQRGLSH